MKIIQSFWSGNLKEFRDNRGWLSYEHHWLGWILSCNQLLKFYDEVELYTDSFGYEILIEKLQLPYTAVHVVLDEMNNYPKDLWAIAKIKTYSLQEEPFLHVDGDVFIWDKFPENLIDSELICQNLENTTDYYREMWNAMVPNLKFIPHQIQDYHNGLMNFGCNMGIIGGKSISFIKKYSEKSFEFVNRNKDTWDKLNLFNFNIFFEQQLFYEMAHKNSVSINYLFDEIWGDNSYLDLANFNDIPHKRFYLHLLGDFKRRPHICKKLEIYVLKDYPAFFHRLKDLIPEKYEYFDQEITNYHFTKTDNNNLINNFKKQLVANTVNFNSKMLLARDLFLVQLVKKYDDYITKNLDFELVLLQCFELEECENSNNEENLNLKVKECDGTFNFFDFDEIDKLMVDELKNPILKSQFFKIMYNHLAEDLAENDLQDFTILLTKRLRYFLDCKILVILNE